MDKKGKRFKIDARLILQLGRDSIKDHTTALVELIKNSFDADASIVEVSIVTKAVKKYIRVADNGFGMTEKEIEDNWLRIGYSEKRQSKLSQKGRRKTGEKGIGRIASDRLGAVLKMTTKSAADVIQGIQVNWDDFDTDKKSIDDISLQDVKNPKISIPIRKNEPPRDTGTELFITNLRTAWADIDIQNLYQELSYFSPLFSDEFEIDLKNDINPNYSKKVSSSIYKTAEIELEVIYDGVNTLIYNFKNKIAPSKNKTEILPLNQVIQRKEYSPLECGQITLKLYFFVRKKDLLEGTKFSLSELKDFLTTNYGVKLYRDNVVVKPYGFSNSQFGQDWLGLDAEKAENPAGLGRESYRVNANNIVGYAYFKRDENPLLTDSSAREGLVENKAFFDLKDLINASIKLLSSYRVDINKETLNEKKVVNTQQSTHKYLKSVRFRLTEVADNISGIKAYLERNKDAKANLLLNSVNTLESVISETEKNFEELLDEKRVLSALATLGISSAVFGHETETAIRIFKDAAGNAKGYLEKENPDIEVALDQLREALTQAKLISSWGIFALSRIEKEKRIKRKRVISDIIKNIIEQIKPALNALDITVDLKVEKIYASTFTMDIESIFLNLLTNAFNAVQNSDRKRKITVKLESQNNGDIKGMLLSVSDSGPGIAPEYKDKIWEPLFTTKIGSKERESGTGLGLTIVKSVVTEIEGNIRLESDSELKGAKFIIWLPRN